MACDESFILTYYFPQIWVLAPFVHRRLYLRWKNSLRGDKLDVICSYPNRYETYESEAEFEERRKNDDPPIAVPKHQSDMLSVYCVCSICSWGDGSCVEA